VCHVPGSSTALRAAAVAGTVMLSSSQPRGTDSTTVQITAMAVRRCSKAAVPRVWSDAKYPRCIKWERALQGRQCMMSQRIQVMA
jgi:hypothetical protein